jgi:phosphate transport system protein
MNPEKQLIVLKQKLIEMGGLAEDAVQRAIKALVNRDSGLAASAKEQDKAIDELELEIDEMAIALLSGGLPPGQVRLLTVVMKIARDLERVGDEATTISRRAFDLTQEPQLNLDLGLPETAETSVNMLGEALEAFVSGDSEAARRLIPLDKEIDAINKRVQRDLATQIMQAPNTTTRCLNLMVISKSLERIADHATNIAEDVVYLYEGRDIRHTGKGKVRLGERPKED